MHVYTVCALYVCVHFCMEISECEAEAVEKEVVLEVFSEAYVAVCLLVCVSVCQSKGGRVQIHRAPVY